LHAWVSKQLISLSCYFFIRSVIKLYLMDKRRQLGTTDLQVAPLVLGGNVFGWTISEPDSFKVLDAFTGSGFNFIDTADVYSRWKSGNSGGESETILGNWVKKRSNRSQVLIGTVPRWAVIWAMARKD
jgi:aryl-alcohol dehydrogenase-like predicted oxidoreductase